MLAPPGAAGTTKSRRVNPFFIRSSVRTEAQKEVDYDSIVRETRPVLAEEHMAVARASGSGLTEVPTAIQLAMQKLGITPKQFAFEPKTPQDYELAKAQNRIMNGELQLLPDRMVRFVALKGRGLPKAMAIAELERREEQRAIGPTESDQPWLEKLFKKEPLTALEKARAVTLGYGYPRLGGEKLGTWQFTKKAYEHRRQWLQQKRAQSEAARPAAGAPLGTQPPAAGRQRPVTGAIPPATETVGRRVNEETDEELISAARQSSGFDIAPAKVRLPADAAAGAAIARLFGRRVVFYEGEGPDGFFLPGRPNVLFINAKTRYPHLVVIGHELLHSLRRADQKVYDTLLGKIKDLIVNREEYRAWLADQLKQEGKPLEGAALEDLVTEEMVADFFGDHMKDAAFWNLVFRGEAKTFVEKVRRVIALALDAIRIRLASGKKAGYGSERYIKDVDAVRLAMAQAFQEWLKSTGTGKTTEGPILSRPSRPLSERIKEFVSSHPSKLGQKRMYKVISQMYEMAKKGEPYRIWYKDTVQELLRAFNGNKTAVERFIQVIAITSASTEVKTNFTIATKALVQYSRGEPIRVATESVNRKLNDLLYFGVQWEGRKTNNFYQNFMTELYGTPSKETTQDMHSGMLIFGKKKLTDAEYTLADQMTKFVAQELGWPIHETQAAYWVMQKAKSLYER
jgi:hypothetical protein